MSETIRSHRTLYKSEHINDKRWSMWLGTYLNGVTQRSIIVDKLHEFRWSSRGYDLERTGSRENGHFELLRGW